MSIVCRRPACIQRDAARAQVQAESVSLFPSPKQAWSARGQVNVSSKQLLRHSLTSQACLRVAFFFVHTRWTCS
jgi:hypothetical protein